MSFKCNFCAKEFQSEKNLLYHQKNTKKCLKLQNKDCNFQCEGCLKDYSVKTFYFNHVKDCSAYILKQKDKIIENLMNENKNLADFKEKHSKHKFKKANIVSLSCITNDFINSQVSLINESVIRNSSVQLYDFIYNCVKHKIICVDKSRYIFKYKDEKNNVITDVRLNLLLKKIYSAIKEKWHGIFEEIRTDLDPSTLLGHCLRLQLILRGSEGQESSKTSDVLKKIVLRLQTDSYYSIDDDDLMMGDDN
jgi:hypothetical protein